MANGIIRRKKNLKNVRRLKGRWDLNLNDKPGAVSRRGRFPCKTSEQAVETRAKREGTKNRSGKMAEYQKRGGGDEKMWHKKKNKAGKKKVAHLRATSLLNALSACTAMLKNTDRSQRWRLRNNS